MAVDNAKLRQVVGLLAGKNCGKCGYPNCGKFAVALVEGKASPLDCRNSQDNLGAICQALGIEVPRAAGAAAGGDISEGRRHGRHGHHHHSGRGAGRERIRDHHPAGHGSHHQGRSGRHGLRRLLFLF